MTDTPTESNLPAETAADAPTQGRRGKAGRPSLEESQQGGKASPQIAFRVNDAVRSKAQEVAAKEGLNVSQLGRKALREYLAKH